MAETKGNILKVRLGNDIRRQVLYNTSISYNDLVLMLQRIFGQKLHLSDDVTLKYFDEDDDLISIVDDSDFAHAREYSQTGVVNMVVYVNGKDVRTSVDGSIVRKELGQLRDKVNSLIDTLDNQVSVGGMTIDSTIETIHSSEDVEVIPVKPVSTETISIFDPFKSSSVAITTSSSANITETTSVLPVQSTIMATSTNTDMSSSNTSHLFHGQSDSNFIDQTQPITQLPTQQTGQTGVPQTGQQLQSQANPTAPPSSASPKPTPTQQSGYSNYPGTAYQGGGSSYATGQANFPSSQQSSYQSSQTGYPGSQTGQMNYQQSPQTNYSGGAYGPSYPNQPSVPTPPVAPSSSTQYPPPNQGTYPPSANYVPPPNGYTQPPGQYGAGQNPPTGYPMGGAGRGGRVNAYGQTPYKVGY